MKQTIDYLSQFDVLQIRTKLDAQLRTSFRTMNMDSLQSALAAPRQAFFGQEMYSSIWDKAAALLVGLIRNHPFVDGNKRIAFIAVTEFLQRNGYDLHCDQTQATAFTRTIALGNEDTTAIGQWLSIHARSVV